MMKLVSNFVFHPGMYGVNVKRIDNDPHSATISTIAARGIFKKNLKIRVIFFRSSTAYLSNR